MELIATVRARVGLVWKVLRTVCGCTGGRTKGAGNTEQRLSHRHDVWIAVIAATLLVHGEWRWESALEDVGPSSHRRLKFEVAGVGFAWVRRAGRVSDRKALG